MGHPYKSLKKLFQIGLCIIFFVFLVHPSIASDGNREFRSLEMFKILQVLENRVGNDRLVEKAKIKISTLSSDQFHLISSLSERIVSEDHNIGTNIAFLLLTALIALPQPSR